MPRIDSYDHTMGFNEAGTWVELSRLADAFGVPVEKIEEALDAMDLDWIGDDLSDRAEALMREELVDIFGE